MSFSNFLLPIGSYEKGSALSLMVQDDSARMVVLPQVGCVQH